MDFLSGDDRQGLERLRQREGDPFIDEGADFNFSVELGFEAIEQFVHETLRSASAGGDEDGVGVFHSSSGSGGVRRANRDRIKVVSGDSVAHGHSQRPG